MLYLIAPEIHYQKRHSWLEDLFNKEDFDYLIVESNIGEREAKKTGFYKETLLYNEHTKPQEEKAILEKLKTNKAALLSDGGFPCLGDPGSTLVRLCHQNSIPIQTRGIHSYLMAALLMSGCNANQFKFIGYPPVSDQTERNIDVAPKDIDGDGRIDLALASQFNLNNSTRGGGICVLASKSRFR